MTTKNAFSGDGEVLSAPQTSRLHDEATRRQGIPLAEPFLYIESEEQMDTTENIKTTVPVGVGKRYLVDPNGNHILIDPLPEGSFLMHEGEGCSYRIWVQEKKDLPKLARLVRCRCDLGSDLAAAEIPIHYRYPKNIYTVWIAE